MHGERKPKVELHISSLTRTVWHDQVTWTFPGLMPSVGDKIYLGDDCWPLTVETVGWYPGREGGTVVILAAASEPKQRDAAFIEQVLAESGLL